MLSPLSGGGGNCIENLQVSLRFILTGVAACLLCMNNNHPQ
ncbi:Hypothetical protein I595_979 [Croceitalea dokdonensis DOKDO 023]|uniref:Uncharacterized protein n=1 Tax=Croceitalea dokdonensis DOKDO 023 TaxID=1300341 RepID=A0A0P7B2N9_9FLAO|nr:Hypothetical protein I595_979 [Croceitalea dokdonensis DOKDO 023]